MRDAFLLGLLFGIGAALAVGPIFVTIIHEAATSGFMASFRVILGSALADVLLLIPAIALSWAMSHVASASAWIGVGGGVFFVYLGISACRDAWRFWHSSEVVRPANSWSFWKGLLGNLLNPLSWTFWLATGSPTMLHIYSRSGGAGLLLYTTTWFVAACGIEMMIALVVVRSRQLVGPRGMAVFNGFAAAMFIWLAGNLITHSF